MWPGDGVIVAVFGSFVVPRSSWAPGVADASCGQPWAAIAALPRVIAYLAVPWHRQCLRCWSSGRGLLDLRLPRRRPRGRSRRFGSATPCWKRFTRRRLSGSVSNSDWSPTPGVAAVGLLRVAHYRPQTLGQRAGCMRERVGVLEGS